MPPRRDARSAGARHYFPRVVGIGDHAGGAVASLAPTADGAACSLPIELPISPRPFATGMRMHDAGGTTTPPTDRIGPEHGSWAPHLQVPPRKFDEPTTPAGSTRAKTPGRREGLAAAAAQHHLKEQIHERLKTMRLADASSAARSAARDSNVSAEGTDSANDGGEVAVRAVRAGCESESDVQFEME